MTSEIDNGTCSQGDDIMDSDIKKSLAIKYVMYDFLTKPVTRKGLSTVALMHDYFPYDKSNMNCWYDFSKEMKLALENGMKSLELSMNGKYNNDVYIVSVEDVQDEWIFLCITLFEWEVYDGYPFDVKSISFTMDLTKDFELEDDLIADLEKNANAISYRIIKNLLPEDIRIKGYQMAEAYTYLYSVENSLRLFIEKVAKEKYGENYFSSLTITRNFQRTIEERESNSNAQKWLGVRGTKLFYLDFKDLGAVIDNNWDIFKDYFPSQDFITSKLNDMS